MSTESNLQSRIVKYLKSKGCYVVKTRPGVGTPDGCPDIIFMLEGFWGALEVKASPIAEYQPLQKITLERMNQWSWARRVDPTDWVEVKTELEAIL
jgi:Holliday junction resolvase